MIEVRLPGTGELHTWSFDEWEERVRAGRVPEDALVRFPSVTGEAFVPASELQSYRALRQDAARAWQASTSRVPLVTALLVGIQVRIWWFAVLPRVRGFVSTELTSFTPRVLEDGEVWRLLTMGFLQIDALHLFTNMMWLAYVGWNLERTVGRVHLLAIYGASVLCGGLFSVFGSPWVPSLGASGGVFGLVAAAAVFGLVRSDLLGGRLARGFGLVMVPYLLLMFRSGLQNKGVDNWCHLGGLLCGAVLGLLVDPPTLERLPRWNRVVWGSVGGAAVLVLATLALAGPRLYPLVDTLRARAVESRAERGRPAYHALTVDVPGGWRSGRDLARRSAWCSPAGPRCFGARIETSERQLSLDTLAAEREAELRREWPLAVVAPAEPTTVGGRPGVLVRATVDEAGATRVLEWRASVRGVRALEVVWQVDEAQEARLRPLRDRLLERVVWSDPEALVRATADHEEGPTVRTREALALALAEVGEIDRAMELHREVLSKADPDPKRALALLETLRVAGDRVPDRDAWLRRVLTPEAQSSVVVAVADALDAGGEPWSARALLTLAWDRAPGDRALGKARRARGLARQLVPSGRPWDLELDPVTRLPRTPAAIEARLGVPLDLDGIRAFADTLRAEDRALRAAAAARLSAEDPAVRDDLVVLSRGALSPEQLEVERADAVAELLRASEGGATTLPWADEALLAAAAAHRAWLASLAPDAGAAPAPAP